VAARLESNLGNVVALPYSTDSSSFPRGRDGNETFTVGSRVRVIRGRHFRDFGAGDSGVVLLSDSGAGTCTVAFDRGGEPLQVAVRHLELDHRRNHKSGEQALKDDSSIAHDAISSRLEAIRSDSPERYLRPSASNTLSSSTALERARRRLAESATASSSSRRAASMPPQFGATSSSYLSAERNADAPRSPDALNIDNSFRSIIRTNPRVAQLPVALGNLDVTSPLDAGSLRPSPQERVVFRPERGSPVEDVLRQQAAELRRAAEAAAAAELASKSMRDKMMYENGTLYAADIAQQEAQALAEAVQASATATATATANAVSEVASLKLSVSEFQSRLSSETEQRAASFRAIEKDIAQLQAQHNHHYMETEDSLKAEQKRLARKQAELVSLCLSLQQAEDPKYQAVESSICAIRDEVSMTADRVAAVGQRIDRIAESQQIYVNNLSTLESQVKDHVIAFSRITEIERSTRSGVERLDSLAARVDAMVNDSSKQRAGVMELERCSETILERLDTLSGRVDTLVNDFVNDSSQTQASMTELDRNIRLGAERMDALSARVDTLFTSLAGKADRETLNSVSARVVDRETETILDGTSVDALTMRVDRLQEQLASEKLRLEEFQSKALAEAVTTLEQRGTEQLQRFTEEADKRFTQLKEHGSEVLAALADPAFSSRANGLDRGEATDVRQAKEDASSFHANSFQQRPASPQSFRMTPIAALSRSPSVPEVRTSFVSASGYPSMMASPAQQSFGFTAVPSVRYSSGSLTPPPALPEPLARWAVGKRPGNNPMMSPPQANMPVELTSGNLANTASTSRDGRPYVYVPDVLQAFTPRSGGSQNNKYSASSPLCTVCGSSFMPDSIFCRKCGTKRGDDHPQPALGTSYG